MDGTTLLAVGVAFFTVVIPLWAVIDIIRRPRAQWEAAGRNRQLWLIAMIVSIFVFFGGIFTGLWYLLRVQPHLREDRRIISVGDIHGTLSELPPDDPRARAYRQGLGD
jgi:hypothetical protein